jgi:4-amino-4-deoxy-L-arabinose transferase-like glycosyltransferase
MKKILTILLILLLAYCPLFLHLEVMPYIVWDESRLAVSAFEMLHNHQYWVVTYGNQPDLWNVKPPLMIWILALSFKILGYNALGLRLPSALLGLATVLLVYQFCKNDLKNQLLGILSVFVLVTTGGFMDYHVTRTGDYDALLILFQVLFVIHFVKHHFQTENSNSYPYKNLYWSAIFLALALMTKGIAALFFCPSMVLFLMLEGKFKLYAQNKHTYFALMVAFMPIALYFAWREHLSAGYLKAVWEMELFHRYAQGDGDPWIVNQSFFEQIEYYWDSLYDTDFKPWLYLLPVGMLAIFQPLNQAYRKILLLFSCNVLIFMLIITFSASKKGWYEAPIYPYLAILIGNGLVWLWQQFKNILNHSKNMVLKIGLWMMLIWFMMIPYWRIFKKFQGNTDTLYGWEQRQYAPFMMEIGTKMNFYVLQTGYNSAIEFAKNVLNENPTFKTHSLSIHDKQLYPIHIKMGDKVMYCEAAARDSLDKYFMYKVLEIQRDCKLVEIVQRK